MDIVHPRCGGLDVHKKRIAACRVVSSEGGVQTQEASFGTFTSDLKRLARWFAEWDVSAVAMESTGPYWRPVWNILEAEGLRLTLANPAHSGRFRDIRRTGTTRAGLRTCTATGWFRPASCLTRTRGNCGI